MLRVCPLLFAFAALTAGAVERTDDLTQPAVWRETDEPAVAVSTADKLLPIVTDDTAANRWAAMFLARVIDEVTGRVPQVFVEREGQECDLPEGFFLGDVRANHGWSCTLTNRSAAAFRVVAGHRAVRFLGRADYAVCDWCERELGVRCYGGPDGLSVPRREAIVARALDYGDFPRFACRILHGGYSGPWMRVCKLGTEHRGGVAVHQPHGWYTNETLRAEKPCLFETGETPMLCYGNPATLAYYKERIDRHIAGLQDSGGICDTNRRVVTVSPWDAPIRCRCENCRELYEDDLGRFGRASPIVWGYFLKDLSSWLAAAHPDYLVSFLPYLNTCAVPRALEAGDPLGNAEAEVCTMSGLALLKDADRRRAHVRLIRDWRRVTGRKVLSWDYGCWPQERTSAPYVFGRTVQRVYSTLRDDLCGVFICGGATDARLQLSMYVWARCLWNPDVDVEAVYDGFARRMFGVAAPTMRRLIALQESCWNRSWSDESCSYANVSGRSFPREDVLRMRHLLTEALDQTAAAGDERAFRRVNWYASGFETFFAESDAVSARTGVRRILPGATNAFVNARSVWRPVPWAATRLTTAVEGDLLRFRVRCDEPAVAAMDFSKAEDNFVWGTDCVTFVFVDGDETRTAVVDLAGGLRGGGYGFGATVSHEATGWTVNATLRLTPAWRAAGRVRGNVCRWRVGDRRQPEETRVPGSCYEQTRLETVYTMPDDDPAAFVDFLLEAEPK